MAEELAVAGLAAGADALGGVGQGALEHGDAAGLDAQRHAAGLGHLLGVAQQAEAGDVGEGVAPHLAHDVRGVAVEAQHALDGGLQVAGLGQVAHGGGGDDAGAQALA